MYDQFIMDMSGNVALLTRLHRRKPDPAPPHLSTRAVARRGGRRRAAGAGGIDKT